MKCENLQFNLSIFLDDILTVEERSVVEEHLARCPLCRQKLAEYQSLRNNLRLLARPELSSNALISIRNRIALETTLTAETAVKRNQGGIFTDENFRQWLLMRFMPYSVGTVVAVFLTFGLLWALLLGNNHIEQNNEAAKLEPISKSAVLLAPSNPKINSFDYDSTAQNFDSSLTEISDESPSVNPQGALIALTKSFVRGKMKDDEVVVVADVFGDGLARIDEVIEPSRDKQAVRELAKAFNYDSDFAPPFVPAHLDQRSNTVRVVLKIQSVNVDTHLKRK